MLVYFICPNKSIKHTKIVIFVNKFAYSDEKE